MCLLFWVVKFECSEKTRIDRKKKTKDVFSLRSWRALKEEMKQRSKSSVGSEREEEMFEVTE